MTTDHQIPDQLLEALPGTRILVPKGTTSPAIPGWVAKLNPWIVWVTPALAREWLANQNANNPRRRSPVVVAKYAKMMRQAATWTVTTDAFGFTAVDADDELPQMQNGQHRLEGVVESGEPCWMAVVWGMPGDTAGAQDRGHNRTTRDDLSPLTKYPGPVSSAIKYILVLMWIWDRRMASFKDNRGGPNHVDVTAFATSDDAVIERLERYVPLGAMMDTSKCEARVSRGIVMALTYLFSDHLAATQMNGDLEAAEAKVREFWELLREPFGMGSKTDPVYRLAAMLRENARKAVHYNAQQVCALIVKAFAYSHQTGVPVLYEEGQSGLAYRQDEGFPRMDARPSRSLAASSARRAALAAARREEGQSA